MYTSQSDIPRPVLWAHHRGWRVLVSVRCHTSGPYPGVSSTIEPDAFERHVPCREDDAVLQVSSADMHGSDHDRRDERERPQDGHGRGRTELLAVWHEDESHAHLVPLTHIGRLERP